MEVKKRRGKKEAAARGEGEGELGFGQEACGAGYKQRKREKRRRLLLGGGHGHGGEDAPLVLLLTYGEDDKESWAGLAWLVELCSAQLGWLKPFLFIYCIISLFCFSLQNKPFAIILFEQK